MLNILNGKMGDLPNSDQLHAYKYLIIDLSNISLFAVDKKALACEFIDTILGKGLKVDPKIRLTP